MPSPSPRPTPRAYRPPLRFVAGVWWRLPVAAIALLLATAAPAGAQAIEGSGLRDEGPWPRWQGRLGLSSVDGDTRQRPRQALTLLGDYYLLQQGSAQPGSYSGGLRATGGLLVGARGTAWGLPQPGASALQAGIGSSRRSVSLLRAPGAPDADDAAADTLPYLGVGYTGLQSLRATGGGWGFSADLGVMALRPRSAVRLGQQGLADMLRELQLSPVLQLGVSYSF